MALGGPSLWAGAGALEIANGYFWDPITTNYFIPRGIAYQTWNPPVGANQSFAQLDYDFLEFKKMHATSVRCEMVWGEIEIAEGVYDWRKPDHLVAQAEKLGLKLFILIGFQYPPAWFPKAWRGINDQVLVSPHESNYLSDVLNYEHPDARRIYSNHIYAVTERYKTNRAIGGWILGNEYAYFDLWEPPDLFPNHRILGYDPISQASFRAYLASIYQDNITALNTHWRTNYANFDAVMMPGKYPSDRNVPGYHDLIQWRKKSIGDFVALGALAAKAADPNHLKTYSMVGGIFSPVDANITCEDAKTIVARCQAAGAPLDFWSINNYAWAAIGDDLRTGDFGIGKLQAASGLPVMISETGHSSTETNFGEGAGARQAKALPGQMWEALMSGAIGTHLFHWSDRDRYTQGYFEREKGFGIVDQKRQIKVPVYENVSAMFRRMADVRIENLLGGSTNPPADVQFFWSINAEMGWSRANSDVAQLWGALKRLGYQPGIIDDEQFERGDYTNAPALALSRCYQMDPRHLDKITNVVSAGIHVHANADLPGQFNAYHQTNTNWVALMSYLFGLNVASAVPGWDSGATNILALHQQLNFKGVKTLGPLANGFSDQIYTWKIWHGITANSGTTIVTDTGASGSQPPMPALHTKNLATAKTAINTFALGDIFVLPREYKWDFRYKWLQAIYRYHFGLTPLIELTGPGASDVVPDYRVCRNGSVLVSLLNEDTNSVSVTLTATNLLKGKTVEILTPKSTSELIAGGILEVNSDGVLTLNLSGDDYVLLYAYPSSGGQDQSLINQDPHKIWFEAAPVAVWPNATGYAVNVGYDTRGDNLTLHVSFESEHSSNKIHGQSAGLSVTGKSNSLLQVPVPDADLNHPDYASTRDGGNYVWHAWLAQAGVKVSETFLPVRLLWGVRPITLPVNITAGQSYSIPVEWQELPSFEPGDPTPLSRADLWDSLQANAQHYDIVLELRGANGQVVATQNFVTSTGTSSNFFTITVPANAIGPFTWAASLLTAPNVLSHDVAESFEGRDLGADTQLPPGAPSHIAPWSSDVYSELHTAQWYDLGVSPEAATDGSQSAFMVAWNPNNSGAYAGFYIYYPFEQEWALPNDTKRWTNYTFSCDFKEESLTNAGIIELQVKNKNDASGGLHLIHFTKQYDPNQPGRNGWDTIKASLDQFDTPFSPFDPSKVDALIINIQMLTKNVVYLGFFDNIQFRGPETDQGGGTQISYYSNTNDFFGIRSIALDPQDRVVISWIGTGTLEFADEATGPWFIAPGTSNPRILPLTGERKFFRLSR